MRNASAAKKEGNGIKKRKSKQERRFFLLGLLFVSPWLIGFLCFQLYPILSALYYSFTDFNIFQPAEFTGQMCIRDRVKAITPQPMMAKFILSNLSFSPCRSHGVLI